MEETNASQIIAQICAQVELRQVVQGRDHQCNESLMRRIWEGFLEEVTVELVLIGGIYSSE